MIRETKELRQALEQIAKCGCTDGHCAKMASDALLLAAGKKPLDWHKMYIGGLSAQDKAHSYEIHPHGESFWLFSYIQKDRNKVGSRVLFARPYACMTEDSAKRLAESYNEHL